MTRRTVTTRSPVALTTCLAVCLLVAVLPASPSGQEAQATLKIGTRVGMADSGYQEIGRRDPFAPLVRPPSQAPVASVERRAAGLAGLAVADVELTGVVASGDARLALLRGPDGKTYLARVQDRLHDAVIRRIEADAIVVLVAATTHESARELRKVLRPVAGGGQP